MTIEQVESIAKEYKETSSSKDLQSMQNLPSSEGLKSALSSTSIGDVQRLKNVSGDLEKIWKEGSNLVVAQVRRLQLIEANRVRSEKGTKSGVPRPGHRRG